LIEEANPNTGEVTSYHWKKYKKEFSICDFMKQKVKAEYEKLQLKNGKIDKNVQK
jgi:hypothetical protein